MGRIELEIYTPGYVPNGREVAVIETARGTVRTELFGRETPVKFHRAVREGLL